MAWTAPITWTDNQLVTAALMNQYVKDNLLALKAPPGAIASSGTNFDTTSTSYVDVTNLSAPLSTAGGGVLVVFSCTLTCTVVTPVISLALQIDGGADVILATQFIGSTSQLEQTSFVYRIQPSAGLHTFKVRMKVNGSTGRMANATSPAMLYVCEIGA